MSYAPVQYKAKDYSHLKGLHAISDDQIAEHLKQRLGIGFGETTPDGLISLESVP